MTTIGKFCFVFCLAASALFAQTPEVLVELARPRVFQGESVRYTVILNHCDESTQPTLPMVDGVEFREESRGYFSQRVFDGFKTISIGGPRIVYVLTPARAGEITIPGPTVVVNNKTYRGRDVTLQVIPPSEQDLAVLECTASRSAVYPMQPFTLRLKIAVKSLPEPYREEDPLRGTGDVPVLVIPWADDEALPESVEPESPAARWLEPLLSNSRQQLGFGINNLRRSAGDVLSLFLEQQRAAFHPEPKRVMRKDGQGRTVEYWEYVFERKLTASRPGAVSFGPVSLKGTFASRSSAARGVDVEYVYAVAPAVSVEVRDVPVAGRPASYIGAVGRFQVDAQLTPTTAKVGDPMQLSLRIRGSGSLHDAVAPNLQQTPAVAESFKVYEATEDSAEGERSFHYGLRPRTAGVQEFPSLELAYFDVDQEQFVTLKTRPIPIEIHESDKLDHQEITMAAGANAGKTAAIEANRAGLFANISNLDQVYHEHVDPRGWFLALGAMAGAFVISAGVTHHVRRRREDPLFQRRSAAGRRVGSALADARRQAEAGSHRESLELLSGAIIGLVADATGRDQTGLTSRDAGEALEAAGVPADLAQRVCGLLEELDAARYGAGSQPLRVQLQHAEQLVDELNRELRHRKLVL